MRITSPCRCLLTAARFPGGDRVAAIGVLCCTSGRSRGDQPLAAGDGRDQHARSSSESQTCPTG